VERPQAGVSLGRVPGDREKLRNVCRLGEVFELEELAGLGQFFVVEGGCLLVELGCLLDQTERTALVLLCGRTEQLPEPAAEPTGFNAARFRHRTTVPTPDLSAGGTPPPGRSAR